MATYQELLDYACAHPDEFSSLIADVLPRITKVGFDPNDQSGKYFRQWQQAGITILANHYYSIIPDLNNLRAEDLAAEWDMSSIELRIESQRNLLNDLSMSKNEYSSLLGRDSGSTGIYRSDGAYPPVDAMLTYAMLRYHKPRRVIEIGSGMSTLLMLEALEANKSEGSNYEMTSIDPYVDPVAAYSPVGTIRHIGTPLQTVDLSVFDELGSGDVLFIDSTHALTCDPRNDVFIEYFKIIPNLKPGVFVHVHDIFLPYGYPSSWILDRRIFWN
jgi:predicted O-methyltransferase YrrM